MAETSKPDAAIQRNIQELYDFNERFFVDMAKVFNLLTPEIRSVLTPQEVIDLELLIEPMVQFSNFLPRPEKNLSLSEKIAEIQQKFFSPAFEKNIELGKRSVANFDAFDKFTKKLKNKYKNNTDVVNFLVALDNEKIKPVAQQFTRYPLLLADTRKMAAKLEGIDLEKFDEAFGNNDDAAMLRFMGMSGDRNINDLIAVDKIHKHVRELALSINKTEPTNIFKVSPAQRTNLHKKNNVDRRLNEFRKMFDLGKEIESAKTPDEKLQVIMMEFAETYVDEREQSRLGGSQYTLYLESLMQVIIDEYQLTVTKDRKNEEVIFELAGQNPKVTDVLVRHLFARAIAEGVYEKDKNVWINAVKGVVRMGNDAIQKWNRIAIENTRKFRQELTLPLNKQDKNGNVTHINQADIEKYLTARLMDTPREVISRFHPPLLVSWFAEAALDRPADLSPADNAVIDRLVDDLETARIHFPDKIQQIFMNEYLEAYTTGRTKVDGHSQHSSLMKFMENIYTRAIDKPDTAIFETVSPKSAEADSLGIRALTGALQALLNPELDNDMAKMRFVNILKAVKRMDVVSEWNERAKTGGFDRLIITDKMNLSEKNIEKLWKSVADMRPASPVAEIKTSPQLSKNRFEFFSRKKADNTEQPSNANIHPETPSPKKS